MSKTPPNTRFLRLDKEIRLTLFANYQSLPGIKKLAGSGLQGRNSGLGRYNFTAAVCYANRVG